MIRYNVPKGTSQVGFENVLELDPSIKTKLDKYSGLHLCNSTPDPTRYSLTSEITRVK
jgi:hypothetical protein